MIAIDDNGNCPRADFYRKIEVEFGLAPGTSSQLLADFEAQFPETCVPAANLYATLEGLRSAEFRLGLITNGRCSVQGRKVDGLGIRHFLDAVVISESIGIRKPDPGIFAEALAQMGVSPASAVYGRQPRRRHRRSQAERSARSLETRSLLDSASRRRLGHRRPCRTPAASIETQGIAECDGLTA